MADYFILDIRLMCMCTINVIVLLNLTCGGVIFSHRFSKNSMGILMLQSNFLLQKELLMNVQPMMTIAKKLILTLVRYMPYLLSSYGVAHFCLKQSLVPVGKLFFF